MNEQSWCISYKLIKTSCKLGSPLQADQNQLQILQICRHLELQLDWRHLPTGCHLLHLAWSWSWDWCSMKPQWQKWWLAVAGFHGLCQGQQPTRQQNPTRQEATRQEKQGQEPWRHFSTPFSNQENQDNYAMAIPRKCEHRKELNLTQLWSSQNLPAKNHFRSVWRLAKLNQYSCGWRGASELWSRPRHSSGRRAQSSLKPFSSIVSIIMQSISPLVKVTQTTRYNFPEKGTDTCDLEIAH